MTKYTCVKIKSPEVPKYQSNLQDEEYEILNEYGKALFKITIYNTPIEKFTEHYKDQILELLDCLENIRESESWYMFGSYIKQCILTKHLLTYLITENELTVKYSLECITKTIELLQHIVEVY